MSPLRQCLDCHVLIPKGSRCRRCARAQLGITLGQAALTVADVNRLTDAETIEFDPEFSDA
jgi:hypothetical protein